MRAQHGRYGAGVAGAVCTLGLLVTVCGCTTFTAGAPPRQTATEPYPVVYARVEPTIDGKLDDAVWREAVPWTAFFEYNKFGKKVDTVRAWMAWDQNYLYLAASVQDKDIYVEETERDAILCRADVVELFVKPPVRDRYEYEVFEFEFNVLGGIWDIHYVGLGCHRTQRFAGDYNPEIVTRAVTRGTVNDWSDVDEGYTIEVAIPMSAFARPVPGGPKPGDIWKFNVAGYDFSVYRRKSLLFSSADGNTAGFAQYEVYPSLVFLGRE